MRGAILCTALIIACGCGQGRATRPAAPAVAHHTVAWNHDGSALTVDARWELDLASLRWHALGSERPILTSTLTTDRDPATPPPGAPDPGAVRSAWEQNNSVCIVELAAPAHQACHKIPIAP